jgi:hypothetical protein
MLFARNREEKNGEYFYFLSKNSEDYLRQISGDPAPDAGGGVPKPS